MSALTARENARHFPNDPVWQRHCERVAAYLEYVEATGKEPQLSPEAEAQVERAMRRYEARERREREERPEYVGEYNSDLGYAITESEFFSQ